MPPVALPHVFKTVRTFLPFLLFSCLADLMKPGAQGAHCWAFPAFFFKGVREVVEPQVMKVMGINSAQWMGAATCLNQGLAYICLLIPMHNKVHHLEATSTAGCHPVKGPNKSIDPYNCSQDMLHQWPNSSSDEGLFPI